MKSFLYRWLWEGRQKWLVLSSFSSLCLWTIAYLILFFGKAIFCEVNEHNCINLWMNTLGAPFYAGALLKVAIVAPLLVIPFSKLVFKVWVVFSIFLVPIAVLDILTSPIHAMFLSKLGSSNLWGAAYLFGTLGIIVLVPLAEWLYNKYRAIKDSK